MSAPFTVAPNVHYQVSNSSFSTRSQPVAVSWMAPAGHSAADRLTLYRVGDPDSAPVSSVATGAGSPQSTLDAWGTAMLSPPSSPGTYEVRMFRAGTSTLVATGQQISIP